MSGRSAQAKGRRAEIELAAYLREHGLTDARPGEPLNYGKQPDITGISGLHIECKRHEKIELNKWYEQAAADADIMRHYGGGVNSDQCGMVFTDPLTNNQRSRRRTRRRASLFFIGAKDAGAIAKNNLHKKYKRLLQFAPVPAIIEKGKGQEGAAMEAITIYNRQELTPAQEFNPGLFNDFVAWIDRSEKTTRSYLTNLRQFMAWLKYAAVRNPQRNDIVSYRQWLTAEHEAITLDPVTGWKYRTDATGNPIKINCKPNTVAQYLRSVCQFFRWTAANNLYPDIAANIHAPKVKNETHRKKALTAKEVLTIEEIITERAAERQQAAQDAAKDTAGRMQRSTEQGKRLFAMYLLAVNAGLRTVEISRANIKDLETMGGQTWLYVWGKGRTEPDQKKAIAPEVAAAIKDYLQSRTDRPTGASPLFVSTGNRSGGKRIAPTTISTMLKRAMQEAGFDSERITAHSLRHSAAQAALQASGDNIYTAQKYLRHSSPATTEIYLHEDERTEKAERAIAQDVYNLYHGTGSTDNREKLERLISRLNPQQLEQLTGIAAAMA